VAATPLKIFTCASDENPAPIVVNPAIDPVGFSKSNYLFNAGIPAGVLAVTHPGDPRYSIYAGFTSVEQGPQYAIMPKGVRGAFGIDGAGSPGSMKDGTSNTIAIGETKQTHQAHQYDNGPFWGVGAYGAVLGQSNPLDKTTGPNARGTVACADNPENFSCQGPGGFGSYHSGTTQFVFADGSVRPVSDGVNVQTFGFLLTADANDVVTGEY
jgi:prepilin-type processing-associated H-X9-DG protein